MTYQRPVFTENVLKVSLSCVNPSEKKQGKKLAKNHGKGKKIKIGVEYIPLSIYLSIHLQVYLTIYLSIYLSVHLFDYLSI